MDIFDQYLFDEIVESYIQPDLTFEDYEEIYQRFLNLEHIPEVKPYLLSMRFLGLGTEAEPEEVLSELRTYFNSGDVNLCGLYYDMLLYKNRNDKEAAEKLSEFENEGYSDNYLKEHSHLNYEEVRDDEYDEEDECGYTITCGNCGCEFDISEEENSQDSVICPSCKTVIYLDDIEEDDNEDYDYDDEENDDYGNIEFKKIEFESNGITGIHFTSRDVDYLRAEVFFEPIEKPCHISVRSKIVDFNDPVSDIIEDDINLEDGDYSFCTTGWGNDTFDGYSAGWLKWVIEINGYDTYSREFRIYDGKIQEPKLHIDNIKLFASKTTGAREEDMDYCTTNFKGKTLEHIYFMAIMENEPGLDMYVKFSIKVIYLDNDSVAFDECFMQPLNHDTYACWKSVGYPIPDYWDKGLYKYIVKIGDSNEYEGNFTIY